MQDVMILRQPRCLCLLGLVSHEALLLQILLIVVCGEAIGVATWNRFSLAVIVLRTQVIR